MELLFYASVRKFACSKKLYDWVPNSPVLLLPLISDAAILDGKTSVAKLLKIFA